jgi:hypothetical protein
MDAIFEIAGEVVVVVIEAFCSSLEIWTCGFDASFVGSTKEDKTDI